MKKRDKDLRIERLKAKARKISVTEGSFSMVQWGLGNMYISPYALALNANNLHIGLLTSITGLLGPVSQKFGSRLIEKHTRKKILRKTLLFQSLMWIPIIFLAYLFWKGIWTSSLPLLLIVFFSIFIILYHLGSPAWFSWMGDIVDEKRRGRYFSFRNRVTGLVSLICTVIAAFFLDFFKNNGILLLGFVIFFSIAMTARLIARSLFSKKYEPQIKVRKKDYFSFWQFIKQSPKNNFGKFTIYVALTRLAVFIGGPFFVVYMLRDLGFSYLTYMLITISSSLGGLLILPILGKFSDKYGNYRLISFAYIIIAIFPVLWLFSDNPIYLALIPQLTSGMAWAGFNLASSNFIYDSVKPEKRGTAFSYFNILNGIGIFIGATLGGILAKYLTINFMNILLFIFLISGITRVLAGFILLPRIKEIRPVKEFKTNKEVRKVIFKKITFPFSETTGHHSPHIHHLPKGRKIRKKK